MPAQPEYHGVIFFDGVCNLCNGFIDFVIRRDQRRLFRYASLQSELGQKLLKEHGLNPEHLDSILLSWKGGLQDKADAVLTILWSLGGIYGVAPLFFMVPKPVRNWGYRLVAKNRYRLFGKRETCRLPSPEERALFLDT